MKNSSLSRKNSGLSLTRRVRERSIERSGVRKQTGIGVKGCGRGSKYVKMPFRCTGPRILSKSLGKWGGRCLGGRDLVRRMEWTERGINTVQKVFGMCEAKDGTEASEFAVDWNRWAPKNFVKMMKIIQILEEGRAPAKETKNCRIEGAKKRIGSIRGF